MILEVEHTKEVDVVLEDLFGLLELHTFSETFPCSDQFVKGGYLVCNNYLGLTEVENRSLISDLPHFSNRLFSLLYVSKFDVTRYHV